MKPSFSSRNFQSSTSSSWWHSISITEPGRYVFWASCTLLRSRVMPSNTVAYSYPRPRLPTVFSNSTNTLVALLLLLLLLAGGAAGGGAAAADVDDDDGSPPFWWFWFRFWFLPRATAARVCAVTSGKPPPCTPATAAATSASAASASAPASAAAAALLALLAAPLAAAAAALGSLANNLSVELAPKSSNTTRTWAAFSRSLVGAPARLTLAP
mmetsp:Transcript_27613/g.56674  ORF Transcript_27613/g.56674 Transcript_27613/m.56674 type:complete len:213 (+) Transcript_27613:1785-2423(+)